MKTKYIQLAILFIMLGYLPSVQAWELIEEAYSSGSFSIEGSDYYDCPDEETYAVAIRPEDTYYVRINYEVDIQVGGCEEVEIWGVTQGYQRISLRTISGGAEGGILYPNFTFRYLEVEFRRYCSPDDYSLNGIKIEYYLSTDNFDGMEDEIFELISYEEDNGSFKTLSTGKLSVNTTETAQKLNMDGNALIRGKMIISSNKSDYNNEYLNNILNTRDYTESENTFLVEGKTTFWGDVTAWTLKSGGAYFSNLGIGVGPGYNISSVRAPLDVASYYTISSNKVSAMLGNASDCWTYFGGTTGGRIKGSNTGSLTLDGNPLGPGDKNLYLNQGTNSNIIMNIGGGNVGIGTTNPTEKQVIYNNSNIQTATQYINTNTGTSNGMLVGIESAGNGLIWNRSNSFIRFGTNATERMRILANGNIGIGTTDPQNALDVKGVIRAAEIKVESVSNFADFVFEPDYRLRSLQEVNSFIQSNGHLPEIPTAAEVKENGMSLSEMQVKLLQKIEELTLYAIEQQQRIELQQQKIEALEKRLKK